MPANTTREIRIILPEELFNLLIPQETHEHLSKARKEVLLALRSIIDARIAAMEKKEAGRTAAKRKIKVE